MGQTIIESFAFNPEDYEDESLAYIVSEGLAAVDMAVTRLFRTLAEQPGMEVAFDPEERLPQLLQFAVSVFLGTNSVMFPGKTIADMAA